MTVRNSTRLVTWVTCEAVVLVLLIAHACYRQRADVPVLTANSDLVKRLELTDLSLFTDARYTRHPAMADLFTPFQDHPFSLEHFPSGSLLTLPPHLQRRP
jgi:hypothetical protein